MQGASQQSSAPPPAAVEFKEEYLSLEAFEKDADILATIRSTNYLTHVAVPKGTDASNLDSTTVFIENHNARSRVEIQKGDIVFCLGYGEFQRLEEGQVAKFPYKLLPLTKCRTNNEKDVKSVSEKEGQVLLLGASGVKELMSLEALFTKHNLAVGGRVWGCDRTVPRRGPRTLSFLPAHFIPGAVNMADHTLETVGQVLKFPLDDYQLVYCMQLGANSEFTPPNGLNAAAWVAREKVALQCGRVVRVK